MGGLDYKHSRTYTGHISNSSFYSYNDADIQAYQTSERISKTDKLFRNEENIDFKSSTGSIGNTPLQNPLNSSCNCLSKINFHFHKNSMKS
jgi:hypothetical protein